MSRDAAPDSFVEIERLASRGGAAALEAFKAAAKDAHWRHKDLARVVALSRAGIQLGLERAREIEPRDPGAANDLRRAVRAIAFNLASFTWPGWDVPGLAVTERDREAGLDAGRLLLRLAAEIGDAGLPVARARWALAAHLLAAGRGGEALPLLREAAAAAEGAADPTEALLYAGYVHLARDLSGDAGASEALRSVIGRLRGLGDGGPPLADQLETARRVLARASCNPGPPR